MTKDNNLIFKVEQINPDILLFGMLKEFMILFYDQTTIITMGKWFCESSEVIFCTPRTCNTLKNVK